MGKEETRANFVETIWKGQLAEDTKHLQELRQAFLDQLCQYEIQGKGFQEKMKSCGVDERLQRVETVKRCFSWIPIPTRTLQRLDKSPALSLEFREKANSEVKRGELARALRGYNLAIAFALPQEEHLGLAYANRAAVNLLTKNPEKALQDINLARENGFPNHLAAKLEERESKCKALLQETKRPNGTTACPKKESEKKMKVTGEFSEKEFFSLKCPSKTIMGSEDFVSIIQSKERGRQLVVNQDVSAGSPLLIEQPYAYVLDGELKLELQHCQLCLRRIINGIPCRCCIFGLYCDETCREKAERFHQYEHKVWPYLHQIGASQRDLIATRIIGTLGPSGVLGLFRSHNIGPDGVTDPSVSPPIPGFNSDGIYDPSSYDPVYHLVSHAEAQELDENVSNTFKAVLLTHLLHDNSTFFQEMEEQGELSASEKESLITFTAALILKHLENIPYNAISLSQLRQGKNVSDKTVERKEGKDVGIAAVPYAAAMFGLLAMSNHSCVPNAVHVRSVERNVTCLVALRHLRSGEEVCITYGPLFTVHHMEDRRKLMLDKYHFSCQCEACRHEWHIDPEDLLTKVKGHPNRKVDTQEKELHRVHELIDGGEYVEAMERLRPCLDFLTANFPQTFFLTQVAQDLFKKALIYVVNLNQF